MTDDPLTAAVRQRVPLTDVAVIDGHAHLGPYSRFFIPDPSAEAMIRLMDRCGVRRAVLSSCLAIELDTVAGNAATAAAVRAHPDRLAGYLTVNPHQNPDAELARWADDPAFVGVKLHPSLHEYPVTGPAYRPVWEYAAATGRPVLSHTWTGSPYDDPALLATIAERHPEVTILLGHAGALPAGFDTVIELSRRHPNLYPEICGSHFTAYALERMVGELGAHRVIYGSDFPFIDLRFSIGRVLFADLPLADRVTVLGGALAALLPHPTVTDSTPKDGAL
ncbi:MULTISPECIES: amidohydrolase family protein [unclassified Micromonospora]|uniref:amidohydrolase family protein n=1 Tax=unclassified Micromonospora TaxID=2617518 RepID=UPI00332372CB